MSDPTTTSADATPDPTTLIFRSESGRTEISTGRRGTMINVLTGADSLTIADAIRLTTALGRAMNARLEALETRREAELAAGTWPPALPGEDAAS